jgi:CP family cyanate transporter-like MFS transporter
MLQGERKTESPAAKANSSLTLAAGIACIVLVAIDLRPGIVSVGPLLDRSATSSGSPTRRLPY